MDTDKTYVCGKCNSEYKLEKGVWVGKTICHKCILKENERLDKKYSGLYTIVIFVVFGLSLLYVFGGIPSCSEQSEKEYYPRSL